MKLIEHHGLKNFGETSRDLESFEGCRVLEMSDVSWHPNSCRRRSIQLALEDKTGAPLTLKIEWCPVSDTYFFESEAEYSERTREFILSFFNIYCDALDERGEMRALLALGEGGRDRVLRTLRATSFNVLSPIGIDIFRFPFLDEACVHPNTWPVIKLLKKMTSVDDEDSLSCRSVEATGFLEPVNLSDPHLLPQFEQALAHHLNPKLNAQASLMFLSPQPSPFSNHEKDLKKLDELYRKGKISYEDHREKRAYFESPEFMFDCGEINREEYIEMTAVDAVKIRSLQKVAEGTVRIGYEYTSGVSSLQDEFEVRAEELIDVLPYLNDRGRIIDLSELDLHGLDPAQYSVIQKRWEAFSVEQIKRFFVRHNPQVLNVKPKADFEGLGQFRQIDFLSQDSPLSSIVRFSDGESFAEFQYDIVRGNYFVFYQGIKQRVTQKGMEGYLKKLKVIVSEDQLESICDHLFLSPASRQHFSAVIQASLSDTLDQLQFMRSRVSEPSETASDSLVFKIDRGRRNFLAWTRQAAAAVLLFVTTGSHYTSQVAMDDLNLAAELRNI